jgi:hypothetical protein
MSSAAQNLPPTPPAPQCVHCHHPMQLMSVSPSGSRHYFCGCRQPGGYWFNDHKRVWKGGPS